MSNQEVAYRPEILYLAVKIITKDTSYVIPKKELEVWDSRIEALQLINPNERPKGLDKQLSSLEYMIKRSKRVIKLREKFNNPVSDILGGVYCRF
jgi:hypothetical protein